MKADSIYFSNYRCFGYPEKPAGFSSIKSINLIIGKNNSGKSHLLRLVEWMCAGNVLQRECKNPDARKCNYKFQGVLDEETLKKFFSPSTSGGELGGEHWRDHGRYFIGQPVKYNIISGTSFEKLTFLNENFDPGVNLAGDKRRCDARIKKLSSLAENTTYPLSGTLYRHLAAERDIRPEPESISLELSSSGDGATNIIRKFLFTSDDKYPREVIKDTLLQALNEICGNDMVFTEIYARKHDKEGDYHDCWEIYLGEREKGLVALSSSGSGLKTILLTLLNLLVIPIINGRSPDQYTFALEELENNMHPALLRKLLAYIEKFALSRNVSIFLTSHSATTLDFFAGKEHAQLTHVKHDGKFAYTEDASSYTSCREIINTLGARASDLLQSNGIIWVEGPSDRIIVNQWIKLFSDGAYEEGRHYQCVFYGGGLLSNLRITSTLNNGQALEDPFVNLLAINSNAFIICDSDRRSVGAELKKRVKRIREEASSLDIPVWILKAREIENYYPGEALQQAYRKEKVLPDPERFESFFKTSREKGPSYSEKHLNNKSLHHYKTDLANRVTPYLTRGMMEKRFDWLERMPELIECIKRWNS